MTPPALLRRAIQFFFPSGKRRKGRVRIPARPTYPPRPTEPPAVIDATDEILSGIDWMEAERMVMDRLAANGLGALASFGDLYRASIRRPENPPSRMPYGTVTGRVTIRSTNPEMDAWVTRTTKTLVRPADVAEVSPTTFHASGVPGLRIVLSPPARARVTDVPASPGSRVGMRLLEAADARTANAEDDTQDLFIGPKGNALFSPDTPHLCRACQTLCSGIAHPNGIWVCGNCGVIGRY